METQEQNPSRADFVISLAFEGTQLMTVYYKGRQCWLAANVGDILGYENLGRFTAKFRGEWSEDFIEGKDFELIQGKELNDLRTLLLAATDSVVANGDISADSTATLSPKARHLLILFESGVDMAVTKTGKPAGRRLRRFLVDEVMPQLRRDGRYSPDREVVDGEIRTKASELNQSRPSPSKPVSAWLAWLYDESEQLGVDSAERYRIACALVEKETGVTLDRPLVAQVQRDVIESVEQIDRRAVRTARTERDACNICGKRIRPKQRYLDGGAPGRVTHLSCATQDEHATWQAPDDDAILARFFESDCKFEKQARFRTVELYSAYFTWCESESLKPVAETKFARALYGRHGVDRKQHKGERYYRGVRLATPDIDQFMEECTRWDVDGNTESTNLYRAYIRWCKANERKPVTVTALNHALKAQQFIVEFGLGARMYWRTVKLIEHGLN